MLRCLAVSASFKVREEIMLNFDKNQYLKRIQNQSTYQVAVDSLEFAIIRAPIEQAIQLKRLRHPVQVCNLELKNLKKSGFDMDKTVLVNGKPEYEALLLAFHARADHARKYWPELAHKFDMSAYPLPMHEVAA
jgi:hypothetical protein